MSLAYVQCQKLAPLKGSLIVLLKNVGVVESYHLVDPQAAKSDIVVPCCYDVKMDYCFRGVTRIVVGPKSKKKKMMICYPCYLNRSNNISPKLPEVVNNITFQPEMVVNKKKDSSNLVRIMGNTLFCQ